MLGWNKPLLAEIERRAGPTHAARHRPHRLSRRRARRPSAVAGLFLANAAPGACTAPRCRRARSRPASSPPVSASADRETPSAPTSPRAGRCPHAAAWRTRSWLTRLVTAAKPLAGSMPARAIAPTSLSRALRRPTSSRSSSSSPAEEIQAAAWLAPVDFQSPSPTASARIPATRAAWLDLDRGDRARRDRLAGDEPAPPPSRRRSQLAVQRPRPQPRRSRRRTSRGRSTQALALRRASRPPSRLVGGRDDAFAEQTPSTRSSRSVGVAKTASRATAVDLDRHRHLVGDLLLDLAAAAATQRPRRHPATPRRPDPARRHRWPGGR